MRRVWSFFAVCASVLAMTMLPGCSSGARHTTQATIHVDSCGRLLTTVAGKHWRGDPPRAWRNDSDHTGTFHALTSSKGTFTGDDRVVVSLYQGDVVPAACRIDSAN